LDWQDRLVAIRDATPPGERHFFVLLDASGVRIRRAPLRRWSTYGEALALREVSEVQNAQNVMVVSTDVHLRRTAYTFGKVFRKTCPRFLYCAVPPDFGFPQKEKWWARPSERRFVFREVLKSVGYRVILSLPKPLADRLMRLK